MHKLMNKQEDYMMELLTETKYTSDSEELGTLL